MRKNKMKSKNQNNTNQREIFLPRWAVPLVWGIIVLVIQILLPWIIAKFGSRYGWSQGTPAFWNSIGLAGVAIGITIYAWCLSFHFRTYTDSVRLGFSPPHLVTDGPYQISRNPMYVSGLFAWLGWTIFFGSPAVLIGLVFLWLIFTFRVIPGEERQLEALFGDDYLEFKRTVRRWIGRY
jgi:protein-S-isoprenylcysteine O-methyltransferase Ste14